MYIQTFILAMCPPYDRLPYIHYSTASLTGHFFTLRATQALISCIGVLPFHCATMYYTRPAEPTDQGQHVASDMVLGCS